MIVVRVRALRRGHDVGRAGADFGEMNAAVEAANRQAVKIHVDRTVRLDARNAFIDPAADASALPDEFGF